MRFTIILENGLYQELQRIRGERIQNEGKSLSLSSLIRELVKIGLADYPSMRGAGDKRTPRGKGIKPPRGPGPDLRPEK